MTLKSRSEVTQDHRKWYHSIQYIWFRITVQSYSNFIRKTHRFLDIRLQKCRDLETLKMSPFDREPVTSYWFFILTISCRFGYIQCQKISRPWNPGQGSLKVIRTDTYRSATYDFLLTFHSNHGTISFHFRDNRQFQSEIANFHRVFCAPRWRGSPWNWVPGLGSKKLEWWGYRADKEDLTISSAV